MYRRPIFDLTKTNTAMRYLYVGDFSLNNEAKVKKVFVKRLAWSHP